MVAEHCLEDPLLVRSDVRRIEGQEPPHSPEPLIAARESHGC